MRRLLGPISLSIDGIGKDVVPLSSYNLGRVIPFPHRFRSSFAMVTPLAVFLVGTLVLAGWLGYQALDAAVSHRRTAEAVLSDYARISATEMARVVDRGLDDVLDDVFRRVSADRIRRRGEPSAGILHREMANAMRYERCDCPGFRDPIATFRIASVTGEVEIVPDTLSAPLLDLVLSRVLTRRPVDGEHHGLLTLSTGESPLQRLAIGYALPEDSSGDMGPIYGFVIRLEGLGELFEEWYSEESLLPQPIAGEQPNDSLLHVTITDAYGSTIFASPIGFPTQLSATVPVTGELGGFLVSAAVRPTAAMQLIIGGLPRSRLPLLTMLLLLTLGVGIAAAIQLRREQTFQRLRDDFVSGVSHELRTPLAQIRMFAELQQGGRLLSTGDNTRATFVIHREAVRLSHLVENILQFSRLRRLPEQRLSKERLDFAEALADGIDAVTPLLEDQGMRLALSAQQGLSVVANREALTRIVVNLLDNAVKYGPKGQVVGVRVESVNGSARLSVSDHGPGVPVKDRQRVWSAYFRLERDIGAQIPGTGIGLSVVSDLAALHGGRAWVEDADPAGARFVVDLPLAGNGTGSPDEEA